MPPSSTWDTKDWSLKKIFFSLPRIGYLFFFFFFFCQQFITRCPIAVRGYACTSTHNRYIQHKLEGRLPPRKRPVKREGVRRRRRRSARQGDSERSGAARSVSTKWHLRIA